MGERSARGMRRRVVMKGLAGLDPLLEVTVPTGHKMEQRLNKITNNF